MPKTKTLACQLGTALGQLHGNRWGYRADPEGSHDLGAAFERYYSHVSSGLTPVLQGLGASLTSKVEAALHKGFSTDRDVLRRGLLTGKGLTLLHGDPNPTNVMMPIDPAGAGGPLYLIDRQPFAWSPRLWLGAYDLVKATIPYWSIEASRDFRDPMLRSYLLALHTAGVQDYTWEDLLADWEACLVQALYIAVEWGTQPEDIADPEGMWARQLDRAVAALMLRE